MENLYTNEILYFNREDIKEDTEAMLQLMVFLKHKLSKVHGTNFYVVTMRKSSSLIYQRLGFTVIQHENLTEKNNFKGKEYIFVWKSSPGPSL